MKTPWISPISFQKIPTLFARGITTGNEFEYVSKENSYIQKTFYQHPKFQSFCFNSKSPPFFAHCSHPMRIWSLFCNLNRTERITNLKCVDTFQIKKFFTFSHFFVSNTWKYTYVYCINAQSACSVSDSNSDWNDL